MEQISRQVPQCKTKSTLTHGKSGKYRNLTDADQGKEDIRNTEIKKVIRHIGLKRMPRAHNYEPSDVKRKIASSIILLSSKHICVKINAVPMRRLECIRCILGGNSAHLIVFLSLSDAIIFTAGSKNRKCRRCSTIVPLTVHTCQKSLDGHIRKQKRIRIHQNCSC